MGFDMRLEHADRYGMRAPLVPPGRGAEWAPRLFWSAPMAADLTAPTAPARDAVQVCVNESRWVVACPDCNGAQLACVTDRRFLCNECGNAAVGGRFRPAAWPRDTAGIEAALGRRLAASTRNWTPGETVADLEAENVERGVL